MSSPPGSACPSGRGTTQDVDVFFDDLDAFGMLYHGRFPSLLERAITSYFLQAGFPYRHPDLCVVVRELFLSFQSPVTTIGPLSVTFWLERLGRTSATFAFRFHSGDLIHAHGRRTVVKIGLATHAPEPWTQPTREHLERELLSELLSP